MTTAMMNRSSDRGLNGIIGFMAAAGVSGLACWISGQTMLSADFSVIMMNATVLPLGVVGGFMMSEKMPARPVLSALYFVAAALVAFIGVRGLGGGSPSMIAFQLLAAAAMGALFYSRTMGSEDENEPAPPAVDWSVQYEAANQSLAATSMAIANSRAHEDAVMADFDRRLRSTPQKREESVVLSFCEAPERVAA